MCYPDQEDLDLIQKESIERVKLAKREAWKEYQSPIKKELSELINIFEKLSSKLNISQISSWIDDLNQSAMFGVFRRDYLSKARLLLSMIESEDLEEKRLLKDFIEKITSSR